MGEREESGTEDKLTTKHCFSLSILALIILKALGPPYMSWVPSKRENYFKTILGLSKSQSFCEF